MTSYNKRLCELFGKRKVKHYRKIGGLDIFETLQKFKKRKNRSIYYFNPKKMG